MSSTTKIRAAIGIRAHSGWAAVVAVAADGKGIDILDRRRISVIEAKGERANQPYHYAKMLRLDEAQLHLDHCEKTAVRLAAESLAQLTEKLSGARYDVAGCVILQASGRALPELPQILASHPMIHTAEGQFFRNIFATACKQLKVPVQTIREKEVDATAVQQLRLSSAKIKSELANLGYDLGPPWTQDQKFAALAAWLVLVSPRRRK